MVLLYRVLIFGNEMLTKSLVELKNVQSVITLFMEPIINYLKRNVKHAKSYFIPFVFISGLSQVVNQHVRCVEIYFNIITDDSCNCAIDLPI